eukprot:CAMPEP_0175902782 /NCGR_PEP_ID=MMETSP0108-20121206/3573_1 /TAXON_ID=195067 ORGANISM="Goniomonas pacifica, Strain CCMP1869" /NCGR_SAMPLE_ID=MMETSP0108 /ASSEMBLY_ACC=CAM_ASM_000204 /LENGTH=48 /DNA_ID= /DNA_START= /DNA_END= /DNA_ORIENTATION=
MPSHTQLHAADTVTSPQFPTHAMQQEPRPVQFPHGNTMVVVLCNLGEY